MICRQDFAPTAASTTVAFIVPITAAPPISSTIARVLRLAAAISETATATTGDCCAAVPEFSATGIQVAVSLIKAA
jgi:hypothetical protein